MSTNLGFNECQCGRMADKRHCPFCGTYDVYAKSLRNAITRADRDTGVLRKVLGFRCKKCGKHFDEDDCNPCPAPIPALQAKALQRAEVNKIREMVESGQSGTIKIKSPIEMIAKALKDLEKDVTKPEERSQEENKFNLKAFLNRNKKDE